MKLQTLTMMYDARKERRRKEGLKRKDHRNKTDQSIL
jgi:hypothetical protein